MMPDIFETLWNLDIKKTFLLLAFIIEIEFLFIFLVIIFKDKKQFSKIFYFIYNNYILLFSISFLPISLLFLVFTFENNFSLDGWFSFLGGYVGMIGSIFIILWQLNEEKRIKINNLNNYTKYLSNYTLKFIENIFTDILFSLIFTTYKINNESKFNLNNNNLKKPDNEIISKNLDIILSLKAGENILILQEEIEYFIKSYEDLVANEILRNEYNGYIHYIVQKIFSLKDSDLKTMSLEMIKLFDIFDSLKTDMLYFLILEPNENRLKISYIENTKNISKHMQPILAKIISLSLDKENNYIKCMKILDILLSDIDNFLSVLKFSVIDSDDEKFLLLKNFIISRRSFNSQLLKLYNHALILKNTP